MESIGNSLDDTSATCPSATAPARGSLKRMFQNADDFP